MQNSMDIKERISLFGYRQSVIYHPLHHFFFFCIRNLIRRSLPLSSLSAKIFQGNDDNGTILSTWNPQWLDQIGMEFYSERIERKKKKEKQRPRKRDSDEIQINPNEQ